MAVPAEPGAAVTAWSPMFLFDLESNVSATGTSLPMPHFVRGSIQRRRHMTSFSSLRAAAVCCGLLIGSTMSASAAVVCTGDVCWHTHARYAYPPGAGVIIHEDSWRAGPGITFREHEGRGYWRGDDWVEW